MISKQTVLERLKKVLDPELGINIVDLGLIYKVALKEKRVLIDYTLTFPGCPLADVIERKIRKALKEHEVELKLVWEPAWSKQKLSREGRSQMEMVR